MLEIKIQNTKQIRIIKHKIQNKSKTHLSACDQAQAGNNLSLSSSTPYGASPMIPFGMFMLLQICSLGAQLRQPINHIQHKVKSFEII
ncbi:MAG: hypothetical protein CV080_10150 [Candidatus Kuenenia stuttgartiensis]|nr:MAG: hypothetical protein CV080_10150 [Candidatus Kuenenia stuttgartiensis]